MSSAYAVVVAFATIVGCGDKARCDKDDVTEERFAACERACRSQGANNVGPTCPRMRELAWKLCADHRMPTYCSKACAEGNTEACAKMNK